MPFENLSIHCGEAIQLDEAWLFDKIVHRRRGGFCYELNGLFSALLRQLGFTVDRMAAHAYDPHGVEGIPFDHMALRVTLDQPWLADVGFGDCFIQPIPLRPDSVHEDLRRSYQLITSGDRLELQELHGDHWKPQYIFHQRKWRLSDFQPGCTYHQTSPESPFAKRRLCTHLTNDGRVSLSADRHIVTHADGSRTEQTVDDAGFDALLASEFGISSYP